MMMMTGNCTPQPISLYYWHHAIPAYLGWVLVPHCPSMCCCLTAAELYHMQQPHHPGLYRFGMERRHGGLVDGVADRLIAIAKGDSALVVAVSEHACSVWAWLWKRISSLAHVPISPRQYLLKILVPDTNPSLHCSNRLCIQHSNSYPFAQPHCIASHSRTTPTNTLSSTCVSSSPSRPSPPPLPQAQLPGPPLGERSARPPTA